MDDPQKDGCVKCSTADSASTADLPNFVNKFNRRQSTPACNLNSNPVLLSDSHRRQTIPNNVCFPQLNSTNNHDTPAVPINKFNRKCSLPNDPYNVEYSKAIIQLGLGKFHVCLALTCGFMFLAAGLQNNLNAYILSSVHCDLQINSSQMGLLNAVFLAGAIASGFLWGVIADMSGRKTVVVYGMFADGILTLCSSLSQRFNVLLVFRFLNGFVVGGPASLVFAYMGEFFSDRVRATVICYVGSFWALSWVIMPGMAWLVIPLQWSFYWKGYEFNSWRLLVALTSLPSLFSATLLLLFPESPRFVLLQGNGLKAVGILARIYAINNNRDTVDYPVRSLKEHCVTRECREGEAGVDDPKSVCTPVNVLIRQAQLLCSAPIWRITTLSSFLFFSNMFGYYGLGLWLPELFNRMSSAIEQYPNAQVNLCSAVLYLNDNTSTVNASCDPTAIDTDVFTKSVIMGVVGLLGNVISGVLAGRLHRRTLPVILMGLSAMCVVFIYFTSNMTLNLVLAATFQLTVGTANLVYNALVVDMFPSNISGMGVCVAILAGRLGAMISNLIFGNLLDVSCSIPIFLVVAILLAGSILSFRIPKRPYTEIVSSASFKNIKQEAFVIFT